MINFYAPGQPGACLADGGQCAELTRAAVWIDLFEPTPEEEQALEAVLGIDIPTRAEVQSIELSSRLYEENGALFMTGTILTRADTARPESSAVTFILLSDKLLTLRYADPVSFRTFRAKRDASPQRFQTNYQFWAGLIDGVVERLADILEEVGTKLDAISLRVFEPERAPDAMHPHGHPSQSSGGSARKARQRNHAEVLRQIGTVSDLVSRARESLVSFSRLVTFFREVRKESGVARESLAHWKTVTLDLAALTDHASFLTMKVSFLLDATLGMINSEQNAIIKILSVAALVFLPPTMVAGIYGMNFAFMPELHWAHGYPMALFIMVISAVLPYLFFRHRGWL